MTQIPLTKTVVSYSYSISIAGKKIGIIQGFNPSANRNLERIREIENEADDTVEIVPGRTDFTITIDRFETYNEGMLEALTGIPNLILSDMTTSFDITETINNNNGKVRKIGYLGCWIQNVAKTIREGTITVSETVTVFPTKVRVLS